MWFHFLVLQIKTHKEPPDNNHVPAVLLRLRTRNMYTNKQAISITQKITQIVTQNDLFIGVFRRCSILSDNTYLCSETLKIQQKNGLHCYSVKADKI